LVVFFLQMKICSDDKYSNITRKYNIENNTKTSKHQYHLKYDYITTLNN
jgi:hypothetical protein